MTAPDLRGRRALVTGASRGLGLEIARQLARAGADLTLLARDAAALELARRQLVEVRREKDQDVRLIRADLAHETEVESALADCLASGPVDIVVNNAAIQGPIGLFDRVDWPSWRQVIQVNLLAPARICQLVIPVMRARDGGKIVNLAGGGATGPRPQLSAYAAAKCALVRLSETLAHELRDARVDVNCVSPGSLNTRMLDEVLAAGSEASAREYERAAAQVRTGGNSLEEAGALVVFLASPASDGITGRLLSAVWDDWKGLPDRREALAETDVFTLRRIVPEDRA